MREYRPSLERKSCEYYYQCPKIDALNGHIAYWYATIRRDSCSGHDNDLLRRRQGICDVLKMPMVAPAYFGDGHVRQASSNSLSTFINLDAMHGNCSMRTCVGRLTSDDSI